MRPFFSFYGSKYKLAPKYPQPRYDTIIEPFAGSACYSVYHAWPKVQLYDLDPIICGIWDYLIRVSAAEIIALPDMSEIGDSVHNYPLPQEAKWLIGHNLNIGPKCGARVRNRSSWTASKRQRIAEQVDRIREWSIQNKSYEDSPDIEATWFIDPPYQVAGRWYRCPFDDFGRLAEWCRSRKGQVMVCEAQGADWLPFLPLGEVRGANGQVGKEVWWSQD